jgi:hypothetical protein
MNLAELIHLTLQWTTDRSSEVADEAQELKALQQLMATKLARLERLVESVAEHPDRAEQVYHNLVILLVRYPDLQEIIPIGSEFVKKLDSAIRDVMLMEAEATAVSKATGSKIAGLERLPLARQRLEELKVRFHEEWPALTREEVETALREEGWLEATEAFAEIAGVSVEDWKQRVEEHKRKFPNGLGE